LIEVKLKMRYRRSWGEVGDEVRYDKTRWGGVGRSMVWYGKTRKCNVRVM